MTHKVQLFVVQPERDAIHIGDLSDDTFENTSKTNDWRNHVPQSIIDVWSDLNKPEKILVAITAHQNANKKKLGIMFDRPDSSEDLLEYIEACLEKHPAVAVERTVIEREYGISLVQLLSRFTVTLHGNENEQYYVIRNRPDTPDPILTFNSEHEQS